MTWFWDANQKYLLKIIVISTISINIERENVTQRFSEMHIYTVLQCLNIQWEPCAL
jgi:hypothetical protein